MNSKDESTNLLKISGISKKYMQPKPLFSKHIHLPFTVSKNTVYALKNVSFELTPGLYGLLGPNGAGKSTMIKIIAGLLKQDSGSVYWNNRNILRLGKSYRTILGYMPQQQQLYSSYSGTGFLCYMAALKMVPKQDVKNEVQRVASFVNLTNELDKRLAAYSGGMKQRLLLATALMGNPKIIILDEPTAGLDPKERVNLRNLLASIAEKSIVLIATHVVSDVEDVATKILILQNGHLVDFKSTKELIAEYSPGKNLESVYISIFGET